ncbi:MAG: ADP-ribosylglycohydrolase family protein [Candidatus Bipolaricaulis sp.]|nr:ADP-ribosylglycohydrolase family protein [Candidatus Bipolaricaulis sp.]
MDEKRRREIASLWSTETASGVTVYPTRAAVDALTNLGADMRGALPLLGEAEAAFAAQAWGSLAQVVARLNAVMAGQLAGIRAGEPATWDAYRSRIRGAATPPVDRAQAPDYPDRVRAAWIGKCIGTALGDPVEGWSRGRIAAEHGEIRTYLVPPKVENDDTAYPILVLHALDEHGPDFTSADLALEWVAHLPFAFTAEWAALENVKAGVLPPESRWDRNPCGAWVGGQMRTEIHGLLAPSDPERAGELAFRDAVISHYREGMDGAVYAAALMSLAFDGPKVEPLLRDALRFVPAEGSFAATVEEAIDACRRHGDAVRVMDALAPSIDRHHWIHTLPNIACVVTGLVLGEGDFERSILTTLRCGYDTDCSTGQTAALVGCLAGTEGIPERWSGPIGDGLRTYVDGFEEIGFDRLAEWTVGWGRRLAASGATRSGTAKARRAKGVGRA